MKVLKVFVPIMQQEQSEQQSLHGGSLKFLADKVSFPIHQMADARHQRPGPEQAHPPGGPRPQPRVRHPARVTQLTETIYHN